MLTFGLGVGAVRVTAQAQVPGAAVPMVSPIGAEDGTIVSQAIPLLHQPVGEALQLVRPLLSPTGSAELLAESNRLVVRDVTAALRGLLPVLHALDDPIAAPPIELPRAQIAPTPECGSTPRAEFSKGTGKVDGQFGAVLDSAHVGSVEEISARGQHEVQAA